MLIYLRSALHIPELWCLDQKRARLQVRRLLILRRLFSNVLDLLFNNICVVLMLLMMIGLLHLFLNLSSYS